MKFFIAYKSDGGRRINLISLGMIFSSLFSAENGHNKHVCDRIACEARNYEHCYCSTKECYEKPCGNKPIFYANCSDVPGDFGAPDLVCLMDLLHCKCDSHGCGCAIT